MSSEKKIDKEKIAGGLFLLMVGTVSTIFGFSRSLAASKKENISFVNEKLPNAHQLSEEGAALALRALKWGTIYAFLGTGTICFGIWKLSGASNFEEFRRKMGSILPKIPKNETPNSRTEFENLSDLMTYLTSWDRKK